MFFAVMSHFLFWTRIAHVVSSPMLLRFLPRIFASHPVTTFRMPKLTSMTVDSAPNLNNLELIFSEEPLLVSPPSKASAVLSYNSANAWVPMITLRFFAN